VDNTSFLGLALFLWIVVAPAAGIFALGRFVGQQLGERRPIAGA